jgi:hypothetical protein
MARRYLFAALVFALLAATTGLSIVAQRGAAPPRRPGILGDGIAQLPNGWRIAPAGRHAPIGDLPLNMVCRPTALPPDHEQRLVSRASRCSIPSTSSSPTFWLEHAWLGLAWHPDGALPSSGGAQNVVNEPT